MTADDLAAVLRNDVCGFADLVGTLHALRFTGTITLHVLNGQPQMVELGRPHVIRLADHPANRVPTAQKSLDRETTPAASSPP